MKAWEWEPWGMGIAAILVALVGGIVLALAPIAVALALWLEALERRGRR